MFKPATNTSKRSTVTSQNDKASQPSTGGASTLHVLYIEDDRINAVLFEEALRSVPQIHIRIAEDAPEALIAIKELPPDVLVIDGHLPSMTGHALLAQIKRLQHMQNVPAFMCSADNRPEDKQRAIEAGFTGYWDKPIDIAEVTNVLCALAAKKLELGPQLAP